ncbi:MAG: hypothetical protein VWZ84_02015 [Pelagibacteraceae bacterium]
MSFLTALIIGALITFGVKNTKEVKVEEKVAEVQIEEKKQEEVVKPEPETFKPTEQTIVAEPVQEKPAPVVEPVKPEPQEFKPTEQTVVAEQKPAEEVKLVEEKPAPEPEAAKPAEPEKEPEPAPVEEETSYLKYILYALAALVLAVVAKLMFSRKPAETETVQQEEAPSFRRQADFEAETIEKQTEPQTTESMSPEVSSEGEQETQPPDSQHTTSITETTSDPSAENEPESDKNN